MHEPTSYHLVVFRLYCVCPQVASLEKIHGKRFYSTFRDNVHWLKALNNPHKQFRGLLTASCPSLMDKTTEKCTQTMNQFSMRRLPSRMSPQRNEITSQFTHSPKLIALHTIVLLRNGISASIRVGVVLCLLRLRFCKVEFLQMSRLSIWQKSAIRKLTVYQTKTKQKKIINVRRKSIDVLGRACSCLCRHVDSCAFQSDASRAYVWAPK